MDGRTSQKAVEKIGSRYDLVLIAAMRAREIEKERAKDPTKKPNGICVSALQDIEQGLVGRDYLSNLHKRITK